MEGSCRIVQWTLLNSYKFLIPSFEIKVNLQKIVILIAMMLFCVLAQITLKKNWNFENYSTK